MVRLPDGQAKTYFLKACYDKIAPVMMEGEFIYLSLIHLLFPALVPEPFGYGHYESEPNTNFILMEFLQIDSGLPDPEKLAVAISELHKRGTSPTGRLGFDGSNCHGRMVQEHYWTKIGAGTLPGSSIYITTRKSVSTVHTLSLRQRIPSCASTSSRASSSHCRPTGGH